MSLEDQPRETLDEIGLAAKQAVSDLQALAHKWRDEAHKLGFHGAWLLAAAEALGDIQHDEIDPILSLVAQAEEFKSPDHDAADRADYHSRLGVCHE